MPPKSKKNNRGASKRFAYVPTPVDANENGPQEVPASAGANDGNVDPMLSGRSAGQRRPVVQAPVPHDDDLPEEEDGLMEGHADLDVPENEAVNCKRSKVIGTLSDEEEESMVEWLRAHPEMYNKKMKAYKDSHKKEALWRKKAEDLGKDVEVLRVWYRSLRTRLGRLLKTKSGQADPEVTERDRWILGSQEFLRVHILAVTRRPLVSVSIGLSFAQSHCKF